MTSRSPIRTRSHPEITEEATESSALEAVLLQLQQMREERREERREEGRERQRFREEIEARFRERDAATSRLEQRLIELSRSDVVFDNAMCATRVMGAAGSDACMNGRATDATREVGAAESGARAGRWATDATRETGGADMGACANSRTCAGDGQMMYATRGTCVASQQPMLKIKPDNFDGTAPLREFLAQFNLVANANLWTDSQKAVMLASCLRGKARSLLDSCDVEVENFTYSELRAKLELRFGESELTQNHYLQFTNRRQTLGEDFATLGADLERLARKAYPECSFVVREKIACSQFIVAINDGFVKRSLQVEGITSLRLAIERAKTLKFINKNSFTEKTGPVYKNGGSDYQNKQPNKEIAKQTPGEKKSGWERERDETQGSKECWGCGAVGHFRSQCPTIDKSGN